jgi:hypothetical protein
MPRAQLPATVCDPDSYWRGMLTLVSKPCKVAQTNSRQILENPEILERRKGPRLLEIGSFLRTQDLVDWLLMQAINPIPNQPSLRTSSDILVQPSS